MHPLLVKRENRYDVLEQGSDFHVFLEKIIYKWLMSRPYQYQNHYKDNLSDYKQCSNPNYDTMLDK